MSAKQKSGMAALEEFLQERYVENYEKINDDSKVESLQLLYPEYFYIPANEKVGSLKYIVDGEGHIFYLIKKSGLPKEIRDGLVGGDAGEGKYSDYASLNDVYGVTSNLKVYYSSSSNDEIYGINKDEFDIDDTSREIFAAGSEFSNLINGGDTSKNITAEKVRGIDELTIDQNSGITQLTELYNFPSLEVLKINNANIESFDGIENASKLKIIYLTNVTSGDYSGIGRMESNLTELYVVNSTDTEIDKMFGTYDEETKQGVKAGLSNYNLSNLKVLEISGVLVMRDVSENFSISSGVINSSFKNTKITKISQLNNLNKDTKEGIENLLINNNNIKSLNGIQDMSSLKLLRAEMNLLEDIDAVSNINFGYCFLGYNNLGLNNNETALQALENKNNSHSNLLRLWINNNDIRKISYLASYKTSQKIQNIYGKSNENITDVSEMMVLNGKCYYEFDEKYSLSLVDVNTTILNLSDQTLTFDNLIAIGKCTNMAKLSLKNIKVTDGNKIISNSDNTIQERQLAETKVSDMLRNFKNMVYLDLKNCGFITSLDFLSDWNIKLQAIRIESTGVSSLSQLNKFTALRSVSIKNSPCDVNSLSDSIIVSLLGKGSVQDFFNEWVCCIDMDATQSKNFVPPSGLKTVYCLSSTVDIDFSSIDTITTINVRDSSAKFTFNPKNLTSMVVWKCTVSFKGSTGGTVSAQVAGNDVSLQNVLNSFNNVNLICYNTNYNFANFQNCDRINKISTSNSFNNNFSYLSLDKLTNLNSIDLSAHLSITISDVSSLKNLTTVKITNPVGDDILTKLPIENLTTLELTNSKVTDLSPLMNAKNLQTLGLVNGKIFDRFSYTDLEGIAHSNVSTLQIFVDLQKEYGKLKNLYLAGCENIKAWSVLEDNKEVTWTAWSGFNGK